MQQSFSFSGFFYDWLPVMQTLNFLYLKIKFISLVTITTLQYHYIAGFDISRISDSDFALLV